MKTHPIFDGPMQPRFPCRLLPTRHCPAVYEATCGDRPCARYESDDQTPWLPELDDASDYYSKVQAVAALFTGHATGCTCSTCDEQRVFADAMTDEELDAILTCPRMANRVEP